MTIHARTASGCQAIGDAAVGDSRRRFDRVVEVSRHVGGHSILAQDGPAHHGV